VLRRPPEGAVLATAHDVLREARILTALHRAGLPVPEVIATRRDPEPALLMRYVDGVACLGAAQARALDGPARRAAGPSLARTLAALHALDIDAVGLADLGRRENYAARQLRRWHGQVETDRQRPTPDIDAAHALLAQRVPPQRRDAIVHGDFRLDNCIIGPDGAVRAVLDWEICALGDPLADLGVLLAYWTEPGDQISALHDPPTLAGGFAGRDELAAAYLQSAGLPAATDVRFYVAFAWWKLACIIEGVWARAVRRQQSLPRPLDSYADQALRVAAHARHLAATR
jgi:aminoglycoside phosphotransferase (APT) family kinase protein